MKAWERGSPLPPSLENAAKDCRAPTAQIWRIGFVSSLAALQCRIASKNAPLEWRAPTREAPMFEFWRQVVGGGLCYVILFAMALTSHNWWIARLGPKRWKVLHVFGSYFAAAIFTNSYVGRLESQPILAITALIVLLGAFALHSAAFWVKRQRAMTFSR